MKNLVPIKSLLLLSAFVLLGCQEQVEPWSHLSDYIEYSINREDGSNETVLFFENEIIRTSNENTCHYISSSHDFYSFEELIDLVNLNSFANLTSPTEFSTNNDVIRIKIKTPELMNTVLFESNIAPVELIPLIESIQFYSEHLNCK